VIASRETGAWWVAGGLLIATCAALVALTVRSQSAPPPDDDRAWYLAELEMADARFSELQGKLAGIERRLHDLERDEGLRPVAEVEREAERLLAEQQRIEDERDHMVTHCGPSPSLDERISNLDAERRTIAARLGELAPATQPIERARLRRRLHRVVAERDGLQRLRQTHDPLAL
jgi:DNA repair exonuclease SbcCD ATPase subunit